MAMLEEGLAISKVPDRRLLFFKFCPFLLSMHQNIYCKNLKTWHFYMFFLCTCTGGHRTPVLIFTWRLPFSQYPLPAAFPTFLFNFPMSSDCNLPALLIIVFFAISTVPIFACSLPIEFLPLFHSCSEIPWFCASLYQAFHPLYLLFPSACVTFVIPSDLLPFLYPIWVHLPPALSSYPSPLLLLLYQSSRPLSFSLYGFHENVPVVILLVRLVSIITVYKIE